ncbi:MAG: hypothetical protein CBC48_04245 [bacterium TMED88]|nr:hypothetical protein [Deltaproteobacteria bacterium]OUV35272.1 MAG: hypothetical protein CBC48_04245 [bacterium TMED88]
MVDCSFLHDFLLPAFPRDYAVSHVVCPVDAGGLCGRRADSETPVGERAVVEALSALATFFSQ